MISGAGNFWSKSVILEIFKNITCGVLDLQQG